jgi:hypothetical protein
MIKGRREVQGCVITSAGADTVVATVSHFVFCRGLVGQSVSQGHHNGQPSWAHGQQKDSINRYHTGAKF